MKDGASRQRSSMLMKILLPFPTHFVSGRKRESTKHDFEFQSRLHECETNIAEGYSILLQMVGTHLCAGFFCYPKRRLQLNDRLNGICFFGEASPRQERAKRNETPPEMGVGTAFRQNGKNTYGWDSGDVAYRNKQGTCISSSKRTVSVRLLFAFRGHP